MSNIANVSTDSILDNSQVNVSSKIRNDCIKCLCMIYSLAYISGFISEIFSDKITKFHKVKVTLHNENKTNDTSTKGSIVKIRSNHIDWKIVANIGRALDIAEKFLGIRMTYIQKVKRIFFPLEIEVEYIFHQKSEEDEKSMNLFILRLLPFLTIFEFSFRKREYKVKIYLMHFLLMFKESVPDIRAIIPLTHILWGARIRIKHVRKIGTDAIVGNEKEQFCSLLHKLTNITRRELTLDELAKELLKVVAKIETDQVALLDRMFLVGIGIKHDNVENAVEKAIGYSLLYGLLQGDEGWSLVPENYARDIINRSTFSTRNYYSIFVAPSSFIVMGLWDERIKLETYSLPREEWQEYIKWSHTKKVPPCFWHGIFLYYEWTLISKVALDYLRALYARIIIPRIERYLHGNAEKVSELLKSVRELHLVLTRVKHELAYDLVKIPEISLSLIHI